MSRAPVYNRLADFTQYALDHTSAPYNAAEHDAELNAVELTLDGLTTNIALIQRDDGALANAIVTPDALSSSVMALFPAGLLPRGAWVTVTQYAVNDLVRQGDILYACVTAHVSGTFATDLAAGKWMSFGQEAAINVSFTPTGTIAATTVQAAIAEVSGDVTTKAELQSGTNAFTGANSFIDANLTIIGSGDASKKARLEVDGVTAGQTRVLTAQDRSITLAGVDDIQGASYVVASSSANGGSPVVQWALNATTVVTRNPTTGLRYRFAAPSTKTVNISTVGPAANGRDQAGAFTASTFVHFYWIAKDDGTLAGIASSTGPATGPTLPSGYTSWAYDSTVLLTGTVELKVMYCRGNRMFYENSSDSALITNGGATVETSLTTALNAIVPNGVALDYKISGYGAVQHNTSSVNGTLRLYIKVGVIFSSPLFLQCALQGGAGICSDGGGLSEICPATGYLAYSWATSATSKDAFLNVSSFKIPNGG